MPQTSPVPFPNSALQRFSVKNGANNDWGSFGAAAVRMAEQEQFDQMVALVNGEMAAVPLAEAIKQRKKVPLDSDKILTAREIGICLGDTP